MKFKISKEIRKYVKEHPFCEACGKPVYGLPHHIVTRGAGGTDRPENLLSLCSACHFDIVHGSEGIRGLIELFPHLREKVLKARPTLAVLITKHG